MLGGYFFLCLKKFFNDSRFLNSNDAYACHVPASRLFSTWEIGRDAFFLPLRSNTSPSVHDVTGQRNGSPRCLCENRHWRNEHSLSPLGLRSIDSILRCIGGPAEKNDTRKSRLYRVYRSSGLIIGGNAQAYILTHTSIGTHTSRNASLENITILEKNSARNLMNRESAIPNSGNYKTQAFNKYIIYLYFSIIFDFGCN